MKLIAHRGASAEAPENTLAAFRLASELGADGMELDIQITRDERIVVIHDDTTARTTGVDLRVADSTWRQLGKLDAGSWKGPSFAGERIPLLRDVLENLPPGKMLLIEIKSGSKLLPYLQRELVAAKVRQDDIALLCFQAAILSEARQVLPNYRTFLNTEPPTSDLSVARFPFDGISFCDWPGLDAATVADFHKAGVQVAVWTVDDVARAGELKAAGVDFLMTNNPRLIRP